MRRSRTLRGRGATALLWLVAACGPAGDHGEESTSHPPAEAEDAATPPGRALDESTALALAAMPLSCLDRPHALRPDRAGYLDDVTYLRREGFESSLAFYGCWDWHSAVNSTWTLVRLLKDHPDLPIAPLIREKLRAHLSEAALEGELAYFRENPFFERPYGWAWTLKLHAELASWREAEAATWAGRLEPLARLLGTRLVDYVADLDRPVRSGVHPNTAFAIREALLASRVTGNLPWERVLTASAKRLYMRDRRCPTAYEPGNSDFLSPCLEEAALMAHVLEGEEFASWLQEFLSPLDDPDFAPLTSPVPATDDEPDPLEGRAVIDNDSIRSALGARSHLIGLAFTRAEAMLEIADALPADDATGEGLRRLARAHGDAGFDAMFDADYAGSHWIGSFAVKYLTVAASETP